MACQRADIRFGGRDWVAWFTTEIPIPDGPYKFCGLPGLIVSIADTQQHWQFDLTHILNVKRRAAMIYSFFAICKKHEVNPFQWLKYTLENIMSINHKNLK